MFFKRVSLAVLALTASLLTACGADPCQGVQGRCVGFTKGTTEKQIQEAFVSAQAGTTFSFGEGTFSFENALLLESVNNVTLQGAGSAKTILDFKNQKAGSEAVSADNTDNFTVRDIAVRDSKGDGIKVLGASGVRFQRVHVSWTGMNPTEHGAYGLYPVQCDKVLIEHSFVSGASDAGIYVGQSRDIVVRRNQATQNVAGIEIENSHRADVYENQVHGNTGGLLVFGLPGLQQPDGHTVRVFNNDIRDNNTANFAPAGNIVATVPRGTGVLVMANRNVEVFNNTITNSKTASLSIISFLLTGQPIGDPNYSPFTSNVYIHDNTFTGGGDDPDPNVRLGQALAAHKAAMGGRIPDILYDGIVSPGATGTKPGNAADICIATASSFINLHADQADPQTGAFVNMSPEVAPYGCTLAALPAVTFDGL
jgi:parallel beta-helix repeat protein